MQGLTRHFKDPLTLLLWMLVAMSMLGTWQYAKVAPGIDYYVAWVAADAVKNDTSHNIYDPSTKYKLAVEYRNKADTVKDAPRQKRMAQGRRELPMTATPFLYWFTGLIAKGDYESDFDNWHAITILTLTLSILVICHLLGYSIATSLAFLLPVLVWFFPHHVDLQEGNVNSIQVGMIALVIWLLSRGSNRRHIFTTGLAIGLMVMFKPNLAPVAMLFSGAYIVRWQLAKMAISVSGIIAGAVVALLISSWWMGSFTVWIDWLNLINKTVSQFGEPGGSYTGVTGITGAISSVGQLGMAVIYTLLVLVFLWWGRRRESVEAGNSEREFIENITLVAMGCIVMMLSSALVWLHYYLLTIPMFIVALRPWQGTASKGMIRVLVLRILPIIMLLGLMDSAAIGLFELGGGDYWKLAGMTSAFSLLLIGLWLFAFGINGQYDRTTAGEPAAH